MSTIIHWIIVLLILSPVIVSIASLIIWNKNKNPKLPIQQKLFKYRRGWSYLFFLVAIVTLLKQINALNAEIVGQVLGQLALAYALFRNYVKVKK